MAEGEQPGLVLHSSMTINSPDGPRHIQLLFGDITKLPVEEKVDVLMVSAFAGDYAATRTSLIGALQHSLGISVRSLAQDKKEDLRQHFHCWQSHPLPAHLPYGEIVCFETPFRSAFRHPAELVSDVFRALIPMFQNQEKSVMTPLLATGDQNFSRPVMLRAMLDAAINWIRAGLPMVCLKIVLYRRDPSWLSKEEKDLVKLFADMSDKMNKIQESEQRRKLHEYDLYFSYDRRDEDKIKEISKLLLKDNKALKIFDHDEEKEEGQAFQCKILESMKKSRRVVTFLSPAFLASDMCVERYNLALCLNRSSQKSKLAPFYIETINSMPIYMTLVQYVDVRDRDGTNQRLITGVHTFVISLQLTSKQSLLKPLDIHYDVFISYSHRNTEKAKHILDLLQKLKPEYSIFFDKNDLKTGYSWQQTLYHAIDNTSVILTLLSPDYIASQVCREEYSIAVYRHLTETEDKLELVPVTIEPIDKLPPGFAEVPAYDATKDFGQSSLQLVRAVIDFKEEKGRANTVFRDVKTPIGPRGIFQRNRECYFAEHFQVKEGRIIHKNLDEASLQKEAAEFRETDEYKEKVGRMQALEAKALAEMQREKEELQKPADQGMSNLVRTEKSVEDKVYDIALICADHLHGSFLTSLLHKRAPQLSTNIFIESAEAEMTAVEKATLVVTFLSPKLTTVSKDMDEFQVALARQRKQSVLYAIQVGNLPRWPTYCHLVPSGIGVDDKLWMDVAVKYGMLNREKLSKDLQEVDQEMTSKFQESLPVSVILALSAACDDLISIFKSSKDSEQREVLQNIVTLQVEKPESKSSSKANPSPKKKEQNGRGKTGGQSQQSNKSEACIVL